MKEKLKKNSISKLVEDIKLCKTSLDYEKVDFPVNMTATDISEIIADIHMSYMSIIPTMRKSFCYNLDKFDNLLWLKLDEASFFSLLFSSLYERKHNLYNKTLHDYRQCFPTSHFLRIVNFKPITKLSLYSYDGVNVIVENSINKKNVNYMFAEVKSIKNWLNIKDSKFLTVVILNQKGSAPYSSSLFMCVVKWKNYSNTYYSRLKLYKSLIHESTHIKINSIYKRRYNGENQDTMKFFDEGLAELNALSVIEQYYFIDFVNHLSFLQIAILKVNIFDVVKDFRKYQLQRNIRSYEMAVSVIKFAELYSNMNFYELIKEMVSKDSDLNMTNELVNKLGFNDLDTLLYKWVDMIKNLQIIYATDHAFKCNIIKQEEKFLIFNYSYYKPLYVEQNIFVVVDGKHLPVIMTSDIRYSSNGQFKIEVSLYKTLRVFMVIDNRIYRKNI